MKVSSVAAAPGLEALSSIRGLQAEAQTALWEVVHLLHPADVSRLSRVLLAVSSVQSISRRLVSQLFLQTDVALTGPALCSVGSR